MHWEKLHDVARCLSRPARRASCKGCSEFRHFTTSIAQQAGIHQQCVHSKSLVTYRSSCYLRYVKRLQMAENGDTQAAGNQEETQAQTDAQEEAKPDVKPEHLTLTVVHQVRWSAGNCSCNGQGGNLILSYMDAGWQQGAF